MAIQLSFRGIPFGWDERGVEHDKRFASHDFPLKAGRWHEDMAAGPTRYTVTGYLLGGSVELARAKLRILHQACANQQPGTLVHPIFGAVRVVNIGFKAKESRDRLGRIDLDLTFEEDLPNQNPIATRWAGAALADAVDTARDAIGAALDQVWNLVDLPSYAVSEAETGLADLAAEVFGTLGLLTSSVRSGVTGQLGLLTGSQYELQSLSVPFVAMFAAYTTDSYDNPLSLSSDEAAATLRALTPLATFTLPAEATNTTSRAMAAQALAGLSATTRRLAVLELANLTRQMTFVSSNDAIAVRDRLAAMMDVEILAAADQASSEDNGPLADVASALGQARAEMVSDLTERAASLKPVGAITLATTLPAVVVAYALYGDGDGSEGDRANTLAMVSDLYQRNGIADPGQMPGGVALEYLAAAETAA